MLEEEETGPEQQDQPVTQPKGAQLKLSERELNRLALRIREDFDNALHDHRGRMNRFLRYYRSWRGRVGMAGGEQGLSNFHVPLTKWQVYTKWAKSIDALFGGDSEIVAVPTGPTDERTVHKDGCYMTWLVFSYMQIVVQFIIFEFHKLLFGRAFAYAPYCRKTYDVPGEGEQVYYEGPGFTTIWPDDIVVPSEDVQDVQDFSFVIRRYKVTPEDLLRDEGRLYQGIKKNWQKIVEASRNGYERNWQTDELSVQKDEYEGVLRDNAQSPRECLEVWEWYGRWRKLKGKQDAREDNFERREMHQSELVVRFLPDCEMIIGVQDLAELYPKTHRRRPIVESSLVKDGSYWGPSVPELLEDIEIELTVNHNLASEAGERSVGPLIFYRPGSGFNPKTFRWEPGIGIPTDYPDKDVRVVTLTPDLRFPSIRQQELLEYSERLTGITEANLGRQTDRPNQSRTLGQTQIYLGEGSIRLALDNRVFREDLRLILQHIWNVDMMYSGPERFFRVTEEQAAGKFDVKDGFGKITAAERSSRFDFDLRFATGAHSKEARKQEQAAVFQTAMATPIFQQNPVAQWLLLDDFMKAFKVGGMAKYMPKPGPADMPIEPQEEWTLALQGEDIHVHAMDDDQAHIEAHQQRLAEEQTKKEEHRDIDAEMRLTAHILEHQEQLVKKQQMEAAATAMGNALAPLLGGGAAGIAQPGEAAGMQAGPDLGALLGGGQQEGY